MRTFTVTIDAPNDDSGFEDTVRAIGDALTEYGLNGTHAVTEH